ncbi:hypothetical protein GGQ54_000757 [Naumannella cuiyingiana]|uniref:Uncharacterized protein n=1 Tax=Naumannella cuiyingiana TaxID=1347891 RepID=A0A7Z0D798_9ACTN|nr:hypothetical protein [Naumannella cuiyingiana]NYI70197.1 hypothetical protein [Naumannella cuiyingiana]
MIARSADRAPRNGLLVALAVAVGLAVVAAAVVLLGRAGGLWPRSAGRLVVMIPDTRPMGRPVDWAGLYRDDFGILADRLADQGADTAPVLAAGPGDGFFYAYQYDACGLDFDGWRIARGQLEPAMIELNRACARPQYAVAVTWFDWTELPGEFTVRGTPVRR